MKNIPIVLTSFLLSACDPGWHKSTSLSVDIAQFPQCAFKAISKFEELTIYQKWKIKGRVVGQTPYSMYEISTNRYGNIEIALYGNGFNPPKESRKGVNDLLSLLTTEVANECNHS